MTQIGFIGLGIMGRPMAEHLLAAGHALHVAKSSAAAGGMIAAGATGHDGFAAVAAASEVVILMVPNTPEVEAALFGADGIAEGLGGGKLVIDMSSIAPIATKGFAVRIADLGSDYLDAPVSGGEVGAKAASLTIMVGGSDAGFAQAKPLFEAMGKNITHVGPSGSGQTAKVANQIIVALSIAAVGEALLFASKAGADPAKVREALMGGFAGSKVLEVHGERMLKRTFSPGFRIDLHHKDLALALAGADELGIPLPQTAFCEQLLNTARGNGEGGLDHSAIVKQLERLAGHSLGE
ncbi:MAG: 2-hydroxy-3-oxopropionate reductase [Candidatus Andeanibacterium colombiense]|uniref:2-hydroxy-3-oxopropionate reductase n=1 Tax=Candidatus Andeanibacterium colombiense TaxID=3121345 RepID=A0AAJ6BMW2_9SPHN|nr:MAG: 2-hydroxy-3-oxopropionate reductase [Sphingomonadaceae bacterium]